MTAFISRSVISNTSQVLSSPALCLKEHGVLHRKEAQLSV